MKKVILKTEPEFELVFARVCKRIKSVLKSDSIDLMTKCEIYHIARSVKETREKQEKLSDSSVANQQFIDTLSRAEKSVNILVNSN